MSKIVEWAHQKVKEHKEGKRGTADLINFVTALVVLGVVGYVGIYIMNEIDTIAAVTAGSTFFTAAGKIVAIINTGFGLVLIAVLALIAGIIIAYLMGSFGGAQQR